MNTFLSRLRTLRTPAIAPIAAEGRPVHVLDPEARIRLDDGLLVIERGETPPVSLRLSEIIGVSIHGRAAITTPAVQALLAEGIPIVWRSQGGYYLGQTLDLSGQPARVRRAQYAAQDQPVALGVARRLVTAKLLNSRAVLRRRAAQGARVGSALRALDDLARRAPRTAGLDALRGLEGAGGAAYFACWPDLLKAAGLDFPGRQRRPPVGPVNALLSYCYAVLAGQCGAAATAAGLDPAEGFLHATRAGRPALALDLMEPFRPAAADSTVLFALNTGEITAADFAEEDGATRLSDQGRRKALGALERRLDQDFREGDERLSWRAAIDRLAASLARTLIAGSAEALALPERR